MKPRPPAGTPSGCQILPRRRCPVDGQLVAIYCLCDDLLKALHHREDRQRRMSDAEVMTTASVAALHFAANLERALAWLTMTHYIPQPAKQKPLQPPLTCPPRPARELVR